MASRESSGRRKSSGRRAPALFGSHGITGSQITRSPCLHKWTSLATDLRTTYKFKNIGGSLNSVPVAQLRNQNETRPVSAPSSIPSPAGNGFSGKSGVQAGPPPSDKSNSGTVTTPDSTPKRTLLPTLPTAPESAVLPTKSYNIGVGVDNSRLCAKAIDVALQMIRQGRSKNITLLHISQTSKIKSRFLQPTAVRRSAENLLERNNVSSEWFVAEKRKEESLTDAIITLAEKQNLDFLFCGSLASENTEAHVVGTKDNSARMFECNIHIWFVKFTSPLPSHFRKYTLATCVDSESTGFRKAFDLVAGLLEGGTNDTLDVLFVRVHMPRGNMQWFEEQLRRRNLKGRCFRDEGYATSSTLQYTKYLNSDTLFVPIEQGTPNEKPLEHFSAELAQISRCNVCVLKLT